MRRCHFQDALSANEERLDFISDSFEDPCVGLHFGGHLNSLPLLSEREAGGGNVPWRGNCWTSGSGWIGGPTRRGRRRSRSRASATGVSAPGGRTPTRVAASPTGAGKFNL